MMWSGVARLPNPSTATKVVTGLVLVGVGVFAVRQGLAASGYGQPGECDPYFYDPAEVSSQIEEALDAGTTDPALIAANTATELFGHHPYGAVETFPPAGDSRPEVRCVFGRVLAQVDKALRQRGISASDMQNPSGGVAWRTVSVAPGSADLARYPWDNPVLQEEGDSPTPGTFTVVQPGDDGASFFRRATAAALSLAGMGPELAYDNNSKIGKRLRREMRDLVVTAPFNDRRLTSTSATLAGGRDPGTNGAGDQGVTHVLASNGRGLAWRSVHYDDMARLAAGLPAKRGIDAQGAVIGSGRSRMLVYVPAVNLAELRGSSPRITTDGMAWGRTGKNTIHPPTAVDRLGVDTSGVTFAAQEGQ